jgi:hypothetical protein
MPGIAPESRGRKAGSAPFPEHRPRDLPCRFEALAARRLAERGEAD